MDPVLPNYTPPPSVWNLIQAHIAQNEAYEMKRTLGEDLIEQSIELRDQIKTLLEIYSEYKMLSSALPKPLTRLPEPPELRVRLTQEILFFVETIREQAKQMGRDPEKILDSHNRDIIDYAYETGSSRPSTSSGSRPSTAASSLLSPHSSLAGSSTSSLRKSIEMAPAIRDKLNYLQFDEVRQNLRQHLQDEVAQLSADFNQIQLAFCEEDKQFSRSLSREPTLNELKGERHKLEETMLATSKRDSLAVDLDLPSSSKSSPPKTFTGPGDHSTKVLKPVKPKHPNLPSSTAGLHQPVRAHHSHQHLGESKVRTSSPTSKVYPRLRTEQQDNCRPNSAQKLRKLVFESRESEQPS